MRSKPRTALRDVSAPCDSVGGLAIDLRKAAEEGRLRGAAVITRDEDGELDVQFTEMTPGELVEMGAWLFTLGQHVMSQAFEIPDVEVGEEEKCEEDS